MRELGSRLNASGETGNFASPFHLRTPSPGYSCGHPLLFPFILIAGGFLFFLVFRSEDETLEKSRESGWWEAGGQDGETGAAGRWKRGNSRRTLPPDHSVASPHMRGLARAIAGGWVRCQSSLSSVGWVGGVEPVRSG